MSIPPTSTYSETMTTNVDYPEMPHPRPHRRVDGLLLQRCCSECLVYEIDRRIEGSDDVFDKSIELFVGPYLGVPETIPRTQHRRNVGVI